MAAGKGAGKAGRPPLTGKSSNSIITTLNIKTRTGYFLHKH
jgi:hypothetical protein